ncbi:sulfur carrier protein ThiS [Gelidibacter sp. F2691]|nr:sulfur carrier protein ThiS [Gelidibacter sp. F2691]
MMNTISVNGKSLKINSSFNILQLLNHLNSPQDGIAVAVNNSIILKELWGTRLLASDDKVLIIQATQGG